MPKSTTVVTGAAAIVSAAALALAGASLAGANNQNAAPAAAYGQAQQGTLGYGQPGDGQGPRGGHSHTAASAEETAQVKEAVKAKDAAITITTVEKDADGSFDARGTKAGQNVMVEVSADYKTVDVRTGMGGGKGGRMGGHAHTAATAEEAADVKDAIKAKDATITITTVEKDPDGSFDARGTKAGQPVMVDVSKDLKTIEVRQGGDRGGKGMRGTAATAAELTKVKAAVKAKDSAVTVQGAVKLSDGSFRAMGTKGTTRVHVTVSKDFKTVTVSTDTGRGGRHGGGMRGGGATGGTTTQDPNTATNSTTANAVYAV